jgi:Rrf2 family cysteine metabolism transcriptional repressor
MVAQQTRDDARHLHSAVQPKSSLYKEYRRPFRIEVRCNVKLSSRSEYGIRALLELAQRRGQGPIQSRDIAERQEIPDAYLNQLLLTLRKAGIVQSLRGPAGGHLLARAPERITLAEVIGALDGLPQTNTTPTAQDDRTDSWAARWIGAQLDESVDCLLREITLETLLIRKQERDNVLNYQI